jgi:hypothetical protein
MLRHDHVPYDDEGIGPPALLPRVEGLIRGLVTLITDIVTWFSDNASPSRGSLFRETHKNHRYPLWRA